MNLAYFSFTEAGTVERILLVIMVAIVAHIFVIAVRFMAKQLLSVEAMIRWTKFRTLMGLFVSTIVFTLYFAAIGLIFQEFGVSLTAYLASASIFGLAIGFGSQGLVQDVVTGLTVIFSDIFKIGDLIELSGQTGLVQSIGMRFTVLLNPLGAQVFIPNRTLANVIVYKRGYVRCFADITLSTDKEKAKLMLEKVKEVTQGFVQYFPGILLAKPEIGAPVLTPAGRVFTRVKFRIWPGRSASIENAYKQEIMYTLKKLDTEYMEWMVSVNTEISEESGEIRAIRSTIEHLHAATKN